MATDVLGADGRLSSAEGDAMRKIIILVAVIVIAAVAVVWSKSPFEAGKGVGEVQKASITILPAELMRKVRDLPVERWEPAY